MTDRVEVATVDELAPGDRKTATVDGKSIGVVNFEGEYYAILNHCPHEGGPVCEGKVRGALVGRYTGPGKRIEETFSDTPTIACPWHGWEYDLTTGDHLGDPEVSIPTFDLTVDGGTIYLEP